MRLAMPTSDCKQIDIGGRRYIANRGFIDADSSDVAALKSAAECFTPSNQPRGRKGWLCPSCGFAGWFRRCGRCGADTVRED